MRKILFVCSMLIAYGFSSEVTAQSELDVFRAGIKMGMSSGSFARNYQPVTDSRIAPMGGISLEIQLADFLSVSLDAIYLEQGASNLPLSSGNGYENIVIHGADVPVMLNIFPLGSSGNVLPRLFAGHSFSFPVLARSIKYRQVVNVGDAPVYSRSWENISSNYHPYNFGVVAGGGMIIPSGYGAFSIDFSYRAGYTAISNLPGTQTSNTAAIAFGYYF